MELLLLGYTALLSLILGKLTLEYLTVHPLKLPQIGFITGGLTILQIINLYLSKENPVINLIVAIAFFATSYLVSTKLFLETGEDRDIPELTRMEGTKGEGHTAVIYFTHGEPETYNPIGWINQFNEFDEQGIKFIPFPVRPLFIYALRRSYLKVGRSNHRYVHHCMMESVERAYREEGDYKTRFYISFLDDDPRPDAAVIRALNDGCSRIIVCEVFLTISNHTAEGKKLIEELKVIDKYGVPVEYTGPMWDSDTLKSMFLHRVNANLGMYSKEETGVLFIGHGQPEEWDVEWSTETEQEASFRDNIIKLLVDDGFSLENLSSAWMEFKEPKPAPKVEELVKNGVKQILFFSAAISADAIHSQYDVPELVHEAKVPSSIVFKNLGAWNNDPIVINALKEKIDKSLYG
jgi:protoheme ferro-lyase